MTRVLILYATSHGHTRTVAQTIADRLRSRGARVQMGDIAVGSSPDLGEFDIVVLGSPVRFRSVDRRLRRYLVHHKAALARRPLYLFSVCARNSLRAWHEVPSAPVATAAFAGALLYRAYNPVKRLVMKVASWRAGQTTDTSRDHIFTDWTAVAVFADRISAAAEIITPVAI